MEILAFKCAIIIIIIIIIIIEFYENFHGQSLRSLVNRDFKMQRRDGDKNVA